MAAATQRFWGRLMHRAALRRWSAAARGAPEVDLSLLRAQRQQARQIAAQIDRLVHVADSRLALPRIGSTTFDRPAGTQWAWRPQLWRGPVAPRGIAGAETRTMLGDEVTLFHDCPRPELSLLQLRNSREADLAPFALRLDVFHFAGSFLSLVLDFPPEAVAGMNRTQLLRLGSVIEVERPVEIFARLNLQQGPNTEKLVLQLKPGTTDVVEFDLAYAGLSDRPVEKVWLDLVLDGPAMNQILMRDLTFARYPRAAL